MKSRILILVFLTSVLTFAAAGQTARGTHYSLYGLHYLNSRQSLLLTFQNPRYSDSEIIPCIRVRTVLDFYEAAGDGSVRPLPFRTVTREFDVDPGEAASLNVPVTLACDGSVCPTLRNGVYVAVSVFGTPDATEPNTSLKFTSTLALSEFGRTILTLPAVQKGFDPQPDPPAFQ